ncbi:prephenate dehydrogenase [Lachnospiraceae bacterium 46-61]
MFSKIGIVGLGLIGGSLAKAFRNRTSVKTIVAYNRHEDVLLEAKKQCIIDEYATEITDIFTNCDIIFICTPVQNMIEYVTKLIPFVSKNCIISDVGSTKWELYQKMKQYTDKFMYIGGHPMTGSERFRYNASKEHLFENAYYILTPDETVSEQTIHDFSELIRSIGAIVVTLSPKEHDYIVASISHVPHIIASALVHNVKNLDTPNQYMHLLAAGGFKDITRIASSSPDMWQGICMENKQQILNVLCCFEKVIQNIREKLSEEQYQYVYDYFDEARIYRDSFCSITPKSFVKRYEITVDVIDRPGSIAIIAVLFSSHGINIKNMSIVNNREQQQGALYFAFDTEEDRQKSITLLRELNYDVFVKD